jgi:lipoyl-dependent peroxiredoxin subunit C
MLTVGDKIPNFKLKGVHGKVEDKKDPTATFKDFDNSFAKGKWTVMFFWPKDFTFVCPTEIAEFGRRNKDFADRDAQVLGVSTDTEFVHHAWRVSHKDLRDLSFPMLADTKRELSSAMGVLHKEEGVPLRATFIADPDGVIRHVTVNDLSAGRNIAETLRTLDALQTDELCPCNWEQGKDTLSKGGKLDMGKVA